MIIFVSVLIIVPTQLIKPPAGGFNESLLAQLAGLKLYALEEMFGWTRCEEKYLKSWFRVVAWTRKEGIYQRNVIETWKATILTHAHQEEKDVLDSIVGYTRCYSVEFLEFLAAGLPDDNLKQIAKVHTKAVEAGNPRPTGTLEREPFPLQ